MTRKDYIIVAKVLARHHKLLGSGFMAFLIDLCLAFKHDNPNFDESKFTKAATGQK